MANVKKVNVAIMGIGTVGFGTYEILTKNHGLMQRTQGLDINVKKVLDKSKDIIISKGVPSEAATTDLNDILKDDSISIVVETMGGIEPAKTFILKALTAGKNVVTANKELVSKHWFELEQVAQSHNAGLYFEASCVGGVPIIRALTDSMQANNLQSIMGIINGTTNYILTKMAEDDMGYEDALKMAQKLGFAEFDPTADVEGFDAMYKLSILSSLAFHTCIPYTEIYREGITRVSKADIQNGKELGYNIKLLAIGTREGDEVGVRVHPAFVPKNHPLASVRNEFNAVFLKGDFVDEIMLYGRGAGSFPTGSAIVSDIVTCANRAEPLYSDFVNDGKVAKGIQIKRDFSSKYYLRLTAEDKAGVLAKITDIFGKNGVSLETVIQRAQKDSFAPIIFLTHSTSEKAFQDAVKTIGALCEVRSIDNLIRVID